MTKKRFISEDELDQFMLNGNFRPVCQYGRNMPVEEGEVGAIVRECYDCKLDPETGLWVSSVKFEERLFLNKASPWLDYENNELFEGDKIRHPDGDIGVIEFHSKFKDPADQWWVNYGNGPLSRLCMQIGDKGRAVKCGVKDG